MIYGVTNQHVAMQRGAGGGGSGVGSVKGLEPKPEELSLCEWVARGGYAHTGEAKRRARDVRGKSGEWCQRGVVLQDESVMGRPVSSVG